MTRALARAQKWADGLNLTDKQFIYIQEYCQNGRNSKAAARVAGYACDSPPDCPTIDEGIRRLLKEKYGIAEVNIARVIDEMAAIAFYDPSDAYDENGELLPIREMPESIRRAIQSFDMKEEEIYNDNGETYKTAKIRNIKLIPKTKAIEMFGKYYKLFTDKVLLEGGDEPIKVQHSLDERDVTERIDKMIGGVEVVDDKEIIDAKPAESITRDTFEDMDIFQ